MPVPDGFAQDDDIGDDGLGREAPEIGANPPKAALHLIGNADAAPRADAGVDLGQIALGQDDLATDAGKGFRNEGGRSRTGARVDRVKAAVDVGGIGRPGVRSAMRPAVRVGKSGDLHKIRLREAALALEFVGADIHGAPGISVISPIKDHGVLLSQRGAGNAQGKLVRLGARVHEVDDLEVARQGRGDALGQTWHRAVQVAGVRVQVGRLTGQRRDHMRMTVADMGDVVDRIQKTSAGMVDKPGPAPPHDLQLLAVRDRERGSDHLAASVEKGRWRLGVDLEAFGLKAQKEVCIRADIGPAVPKAVMADAEEIPLLRQKAGDQLDMKVRGPATVFMPVAQMGDKIAGRDPFARGHKAGKRPAEVPVQTEKGAPLRRLVSQDQGVPVIKRIFVVGHAFDDAVQRGMDCRSCRREDIDPQMAGAPFLAGRIGKMRRGVDRAALSIKAEAQEGQALGQVHRALGREPCIEGPVGVSRHIGAAAIGRQGHARTAARISAKDRTEGARAQIRHHRARAGNGLKACGLAAERDHEGGVDPVQPFKQRESRGLRDQKVAVFRMQFRLMRRDADRADQPHAGKVEDEVRFIL